MIRVGSFTPEGSYVDANAYVTARVTPYLRTDGVFRGAGVTYNDGLSLIGGGPYPLESTECSTLHKVDVGMDLGVKVG